MRRFIVLVVVVAASLVGCGKSVNEAGPQTRRVLVDNAEDQYAAAFGAYFPRKIRVRPGDTIDFTQAWNGEPHSVTMGTKVNDVLTKLNDLLSKYKDFESAPPEVKSQADDLGKSLPSMVSEDSYAIHQNAAQPCYLDTGDPPSDPGTACAKVAQPAFNGRQTYYNSGFIPYEGAQGNTFRVHLADDAAPGTYQYYCNYHGPGMSGEITVVPKGSKIPSQAAASEAGRREFAKLSNQLTKDYDNAKKHKFPPDVAPPQTVAWVKGKPIAGWFSSGGQYAMALEFIPPDLTVKVGQKVTWVIAGNHTVSFGVPPYFPELNVDRDGTVKYNPQATDPVGGPGFPPTQLPKDVDGIPQPIDGGTWDGTGFRSSGLPIQGDETTPAFTLTFTRKGTYKYACLVHPKMIGTLTVR